jgi:large subunit ribosomal protein L37Ae
LAISKKIGSVKRFGSRYGRTSRHIVGKIEHTQRKFHECPYCMKEKARRISSGIWVCKNCGSKFAGKAYTAVSEGKTTVVKKKVEDEVIDESLLEETKTKPKGEKYKDNYVASDRLEEAPKEEAEEPSEESEEPSDDLEETTEEPDEEVSEYEPEVTDVEEESPEKSAEEVEEAFEEADEEPEDEPESEEDSMEEDFDEEESVKKEE